VARRLIESRLLSGGREVANHVEAAGGAMGPAGVMDESEGRRTVTRIGIERDAVDGVDVRGVVIPAHLAGAWRRRWHGDIGMCRDGDAGEVDGGSVLEFDVGPLWNHAALDQFVDDRICDNRHELVAHRRTGRSISIACSAGYQWLIFWPLIEHLRDRFLHRLLILASVVAEGVLADSTPDQALSFCVVKIDDQRSNNILLRGNRTHASSESPHTHCGVGGLLLHSATGDND
jgi:hypothetical protein